MDGFIRDAPTLSNINAVKTRNSVKKHETRYVIKTLNLNDEPAYVINTRKPVKWLKFAKMIPFIIPFNAMRLTGNNRFEG